jgi:hypothetical protein
MMASIAKPKKHVYVHLWIASLLLVLTCTSSPPESISGAGCPPTMEGFQLCRDLLELIATLHYSHNRENTTSSVVFVATPPTPKGWVTWGLDPIGSGMIGS